MKKSVALCVVALVFCLLLALAGCNTNHIAFQAQRFVFYMSDATHTLVPEVRMKKKGDAYTLSSGNATIVRVLADGVTLEALRVGTSTITARCAHGEASAVALVLERPEDGKSPDDGKDENGNLQVHFSTDYGAVPDQYVAPGSMATRPGDPYRAGYRVSGWYTDAALTQPYDFSTPVTQPLTLYPAWEAVEATFLYTVLSDSTVSVTGLEFPSVPYEELVIPASVEGRSVVAIGEYAFRNYTPLKHIQLPDSVTRIEQYAFSGCTSLEEVTGGSRLESIGFAAFWQDVKLTACPLPDTITELGDAAFCSCNLFAPQRLPAGVTVLGQQLFENTALTAVDLSGVTTVKKLCFSGCSELEQITHTDSLQQVESWAFLGTKWLSDQTRASTDHLIYLDDVLLYFDSRADADVTLRPDTRLIANYAFYAPYRDSQQGVIPQILPRSLTIRLPQTAPTLSVVINSNSGSPVKEPAIPYARSGATLSLVAPDRDSYARYIALDDWKDYYVAPERESGSAASSAFWWAETHADVEVLVRPTTTDEVLLCLTRYLGAADATLINVHQALEDAYPAGYRVRNVVTGAFFHLSALRTLILPGRVDNLAPNCINYCPQLRAIYVAPTADENYPKSALSTSVTNSWSLLSPDLRLYVPEEKLDAYRQKWTPGYAYPILQGCTQQEFEAACRGEA